MGGKEAGGSDVDGTAVAAEAGGAQLSPREGAW